MDFYAYRYAEKTIQQAIVQKLARVISGLRATRLLMKAGFAQEQSSLQRMLDELNEDVAFLTLAIIYNDITEQHQRYLNTFFEELDIESRKNQSIIPRQKIRAFLQRRGGIDERQASIRDTSRKLSMVFSGYLHAASPQIMDMYFGQPPKFHLHGVMHPPEHDQYCEGFRNYVLRSIYSFALASKALEQDDLYEEVEDYAFKFADR